MNSQSSETNGESEADDRAKSTPPIKAEESNVGGQPRDNNGESTGGLAKWERRQYRVQATIALVGAISVVIYSFQLYEMRKSTDAAAKAAKTAEDSVKLARELAHLDQRAWVNVKGFQGTPEVDKQFKITVNYGNSGKTFAKDVTVETLALAADKGKEPDFSLLDKELGLGEGSVLLMAPNAEYAATIDGKASTLAVTQADMDALTAGTVRIFVFGRIKYKDIFDCPHWVKFCVTFDPSTGFPYYTKHNEADNNRCP